MTATCIVQLSTDADDDDKQIKRLNYTLRLHYLPCNIGYGPVHTDVLWFIVVTVQAVGFHQKRSLWIQQRETVK